MNVVLLAAVLLTTTAAASGASSATINVARVLSRSVSSARRGGVPVLLPGRLTIDSSRAYGSGGAVSGGYDLELAYAPGCDEATACYLASFIGKKGSVLPGSANVSLADGLSGHYRPTSCGGSCSPGSIDWVEHGDLYEIQCAVNGPERAALVSLVDAAILAGPR